MPAHKLAKAPTAPKDTRVLSDLANLEKRLATVEPETKLAA